MAIYHSLEFNNIQLYLNFLCYVVNSCGNSYLKNKLFSVL